MCQFQIVSPTTTVHILAIVTAIVQMYVIQIHLCVNKVDVHHGGLDISVTAVSYTEINVSVHLERICIIYS